MQDLLDEATLDSSYGRFLGIPRPSLRRKVYLESSHCDQLEQTVDYSNDHRPPTHAGFASSLIGTQTQCFGFLNCYLELKSAIVIGVQRGIGEHQQLSREISYFHAKQCHWLGESLPQEGPLIHHCRSQLSVDRDAGSSTLWAYYLLGTSSHRWGVCLDLCSLLQWLADRRWHWL